MSAIDCVSIPRIPRGHVAVEEPAHNLAAALVDEIECGLISCDARGRLRYANRSAREELASGRALKVVDDLVRSAAGTSADLDAALADAAWHGRRQLLELGQADDRLLASVIPMRQAAAGPASVLIMLGRRELCSPLGLEMLAVMHGLTLAERRVLRGLLAHGAPREIAESNGVALSTVRSQIKSLREKFGVRTIEGLLIRAAEVPPVTTAWRRLGGSLWNDRRGTLQGDAGRPALVS